jgi:hypothetical protein
VTTDDPRHGTKAGYEAGCRELCCRRANMRYSKALRLSGPRLVDMTGTQRRIEALQVLGWSMADQSKMLGHERSYIRKMLTASRRGKVQRVTADAVAALYTRLCMTVAHDPAERPRGWNASRERTRQRALALGYAGPLCWDDIDDPAERPKGARHGNTRHYRGDLLAEWAHLRRSGVAMHAAAAQLGVTVGAIEKATERAARGVA